MIKRIKDQNPKGLIASIENRKIMEKFESDLVRGMSKLIVLSIIKKFGEEGLYGYKIIKELEIQTKEIFILEEGHLYPLLRKLKEDGLLKSEQKTVQGRNRTYYTITHPQGEQFYNRMVGFFSKLTEALGPLFDVDVNLYPEKYLFCPECANKMDLTNLEYKFCDVCGYNIEEIKERGKK